MTDKLKCPFCGSELRTSMLDESVAWYCPNRCIGTYRTRSWCNNGYIFYDLNQMFNIAPFDGDWKDSLMECGE